MNFCYEISTPNFQKIAVITSAGISDFRKLTLKICARISYFRKTVKEFALKFHISKIMVYIIEIFTFSEILSNCFLLIDLPHQKYVEQMNESETLLIEELKKKVEKGKQKRINADRERHRLMRFLGNMGVYVEKCAFCGDWNNLEWEDISRHECQTCGDEHIYCDYSCCQAGFCLLYSSCKPHESISKSCQCTQKS